MPIGISFFGAKRQLTNKDKAWRFSSSNPQKAATSIRSIQRCQGVYCSSCRNDFCSNQTLNVSKATFKISKKCVSSALGVLAHRTSDDEQGVYNNLRNTWYSKQQFFIGCLVNSNRFLCKELVHHPIEPTTNKWMALGFQVGSMKPYSVSVIQEGWIQESMHQGPR